MKPYPEIPPGLIVEHPGPVLRICLDRPDRRNSITDPIVYALADTVDAAASDETVRVIHLEGSGDHFSSGFDLSQRTPGPDRPRVGSVHRRMNGHVNRLIPAMLTCQTPIVCTARGWVIGLGLDLVLASDFAVVADDARLWAPFTTFGFTPDSGATWLIPRLAGVARAWEMLILGEKVSGSERPPGDWYTGRYLRPTWRGPATSSSPGWRRDRPWPWASPSSFCTGPPRATSRATWLTKLGRWRSRVAQRTSKSTETPAGRNGSRVSPDSEASQPPCAVMPPSTVTTAPLTKEARGSTRVAIMKATSSGRPKRPSGILRRASSSRFAAGMDSVMAVRVAPGQTQLAVIPKRARSTASDRVNPKSACLETVYGPERRVAPSASVEAMLTIRP